MKICDLFTVEYGVNLELINCEITTQNDPDGVAFVARTAENNGVVAYVKRIDGLIPQKAGLISCASGGSVLSTFVQTRDFYSGRDLYVLTPKKEMTLSEKFFYCMCIQKNAYRYQYGRQANKTLKYIELPDSIPEYVYTKNISPLSTEIKNSPPTLKTDNWKMFRIGDLFSIEACKCSNAGNLAEGSDIWYIGAKKNYNGIMKKVAYADELVTKGNCIIFICNGEGSVGYTNYMDKDFIGSTTLKVGYNKNLNQYIGMFLVTVLDLERPRYSFGRKWLIHLTDTEIKLPATPDGTPDWQFMESYIKSFPYSDRI
ncbi:MAG: restriction endonuclease subunit S [Treponema sp.]|nr:restriction endonuclease subunit S [Treponema sp.]